MKKTISLIILSLSLSTCAFGQLPSWLWSKNGIGNGFDNANGMVSDLFGNIYITGRFNSDSLSFGSFTLYNSKKPQFDIYIVKYDINGNVLWAINENGNRGNNSWAIAFDKTGYFYITGEFSSDSLTFGKITITKTGLQRDIFIAKFDLNGQVIWVKKFGGSGYADEGAYSIAASTDGNLFITGYFGNPNLILGKDTLILKGIVDFFVAKIDTSGKIIWAKSANDGYGNSIAIDENGNVYVCGSFSGSFIKFDNITLNNAGSLDIFIVKYDIAGNLMWARRAGGNDRDVGLSLATDIFGHVYLAGSFKGSKINFGTFTVNNSGVYNSFLTKYDSLGNVLWATAPALKNNSEAKCITVDTIGSIYITGRYDGTNIRFGSFTLINSSGGGVNHGDLFVTKYDSSSNVKWAISAYGQGVENPHCISIDHYQNIYIAGEHSGSEIQFCRNKIDSTVAWDVFVAKLGKCNLPKPYISIAGDSSFCEGDSVVLSSSSVYGNFWPDSSQKKSYTVKKSGIYSVTVTDSFCCSAKSNNVIVTVLPKPASPKITITGDTSFCMGDSVILSSSKAPFYLWSDSSHGSSITIKNAGNFFVSVTDSIGCRADSRKINVIVHPVPVADFFINDTLQCFKGNNFILSDNSSISSGSPFFTYNWDFGDGFTDTAKNSSHIYSTFDTFYVRLIVSSKNSCLDTLVKKVYMKPSPIVGFNINQNPQTFSGNNFVFTNTSSSPGGNIKSYYWVFGDGDTSASKDPAHSYKSIDSFDVKLIVVSNNRCKDSLIKKVWLMYPIMNADFLITDICLGEIAYFKNISSVQNDSFQSFVWDFGDGNLGVTLKNPNHLYSDTGIYTVQMVGHTYKGLIDTAIHNIHVLLPPTVNITADPDTIVENGIIVILTANGNFDQIFWNTGKNTTSIEVYKKGIYSVRVLALNGCDAFDSIMILYLPSSSFSFMNVITPNGDGKNDLWKIDKIDKYKPCKLAIYNRWGDELYANSDYQNNWDGTFKGKKLPEGTYYFVLMAKDGMVYKGAVNILK